MTVSWPLSSSAWVGIPRPAALDMQANVTDPLNDLNTRTAVGAFVTPTLSGAWVTVGSPAAAPKYCLIAGIVYITGAVKTGTGNVFTLPAGMRPLAQIGYTGSSGANGSASILITAAGVVSVAGYSGSGSTTIGVNIDWHFVAEQ